MKKLKLRVVKKLAQGDSQEVERGFEPFSQQAHLLRDPLEPVLD